MSQNRNENSGHSYQDAVLMNRTSRDADGYRNAPQQYSLFKAVSDPSPLPSSFVIMSKFPEEKEKSVSKKKNIHNNGWMLQYWVDAACTNWCQEHL